MQSKEMFEQVQKMFAKEYGIDVGYNSESELLYFKGDVATDLPVSASARKYIMDALTSTAGKRESERKYGTLHFGFNILSMIGDVDMDSTVQKNIYIDLADFNDDFSRKNFEYHGVPIRADNLGRVFEHEWIGHFLNNIKKDGGDYTPGPTEMLVNTFRVEMGLGNYQALNYGTQEGQFKFFGNTTTITSSDVKVQLKAAIKSLMTNYYAPLYNGKSATAPSLAFPYILRPPRNK